MPRRASVAIACALGLALPLAGCHDDLTEVVLVVESDLAIPTEVDGADFIGAAGPSAPSAPQFPESGQLLQKFPLSVGILSQGTTDGFSIVARLFHDTLDGANAMLVVRRTVTDVRFVPHQTMMLRLPMPRACACQGTSCPDQGLDCENLNNPELLPFDPAIAPPSTMMGFAGQPGQVKSPPLR